MDNRNLLVSASEVYWIEKRVRTLISIVTLTGVLTGCISIPQPKIGQSPFVYPNSCFESETNRTAWAGLESMGITNRDDYVRVLSDFLSSSGLFTQEECTALHSDPFLTTPDLPFVTFQTFDPAERVAKYYQAQFKNHAWQKVRGGLLVESCNGGGDWIRVYQKGRKLVHIHIFGPWKRDQEERKGIAKDEYTMRRIMFRFIGVEPAEILGLEYRNKTWDDPTIRMDGMR